MPGSAAVRRHAGSPGPAPEADLTPVVHAVLRAGSVVLAHFGREATVEYKAPDQPLTQADPDADRAIADMLRSARPGYGWLSEETPDRSDRESRDRVWIVDPIDGTRSFLAGRPEFAIGVGPAERGRATVGAVYNPAAARLYWALRYNRPDPYVRGIVTTNGRLHDALLARIRSLPPTGRMRDPSKGEC